MSDTPPRITRARALLSPNLSPNQTDTSKPPRKSVKAEAEDKAPAPDGDTPMSELAPADVTAAAQTGSDTVTTEKKVEEKEDDFADLFNDLAIREEDDDDYSQVLARNYVTWGRFDKKQTEKASALMKSTLNKKGRKGIDFCGTIKKWFFTNEMWAADSTQTFMKEHNWRAYELTEDDKEKLRDALAAGEIKNLHVK